MSTLSIRALHVPKVWPFPGLAHAFAVILTVIDAFSEALDQAHEVQKNYPFAY